MTNIIKMANEGNVGELKGRLASYRRMGMNVAIVSIPVRLLAIDERYQTGVRTERELGYLINNWDDRKLLPLTGVPHDDEGLIYLVDGYGRWKASQIVDPDKYREMNVMVLLDAPTDPDERLMFEAEQYAYQNKHVAKLTPVQKHGAFEILGHEDVAIINALREKYGFEFEYKPGMRREGCLGSYPCTLNNCRKYGKDCMEYVFDVLYGAGFDRKSNGLSACMVKVITDMWLLYADNRDETKKYLTEELRGMDARFIKSNAVSKYPMLDYRASTSLWVEDLLVAGLKVKQKRIVMNNRLVNIEVA